MTLDRREPTFGHLYSYSVHGLCVVSDFAIEDMRFNATDEASSYPQLLTTLRAKASEIPQPARGDWIVRSKSDVSIGTTASGLVFESYCGSRALLSDASDEAKSHATLYVARPPSISTTRFNHTVMHSFIPHSLAARGHIFLHAACVDIGGFGLLVAGDGGRGKSTIAAGFSLRGNRVFAEDVVRVTVGGGTMVAYPSYLGARLRSDNFLLPDRLRSARQGRYGLPKHRIEPAIHSTRMGSIDGGALVVSSALFLASGPSITGQLHPLSGVGTLQHLLMHGLFAGAGRDAFMDSWLPAVADGLAAVRGANFRFRKSVEHFPVLLGTIESFALAKAGARLDA